MKACAPRTHKLIVIQEHGYGFESNVVRWCRVCGAIVVDQDYDGRTAAGAIMPMRLPEVSK